MFDGGHSNGMALTETLLEGVRLRRFPPVARPGPLLPAHRIVTRSKMVANTR